MPPVVRYREIADDLRGWIKAGTIKPGEHLRVIGMTEKFWCARNTAIEALRHLEAEGFLLHIGGEKGWRVLSPDQGRKRDPAVTRQVACPGCGHVLLVTVHVDYGSADPPTPVTCDDAAPQG